MKKETYYILTDEATLLNPGKVSFKSTTGEPVKIKGYEKYDFFIHDVSKNEYHQYALSEGTTGLRIGGSGQTKKEVIRNALNILNRMSKKELNRVIKHYVSEYGLSPKYRMNV